MALGHRCCSRLLASLLLVAAVATRDASDREAAADGCHEASPSGRWRHPYRVPLPFEDQYPNKAADLRRAVVVDGAQGRLEALFAKARLRKELTVAVFGGSETAGKHCGEPRNPKHGLAGTGGGAHCWLRCAGGREHACAWPQRVIEFLRHQFPLATIRSRDFATGSTTSTYS